MKFSGIRCSLLLLVPLLTVAPLAAQAPEPQEKIAAIKQASARNKQSLARYTWQEKQTISVKGEVKKQVLYQVQLGMDGKPAKTLISESQQSSSASSESTGGMGRRRGGRVKEKVVEKKKADFKEYGQQVGTLVQSYAHPDPERLQAAVQSGKLTLAPASSGTVQMTIRGYLKPNDAMKVSLDPATHLPQSVDVDSYLEEPSDKVTMTIGFRNLPDGTNYPAHIQVNGESKQLAVVIENSNYRKE